MVILEYQPEWDAPIVGPVVTIQRQQAHREFVRAVEPSVVIMPYVEARRVAKDGLSLAEWLPTGEATTTITTTTVADDKLERIPWKREAEKVRVLEPDYHIPTDYPVYGDDDPDQRVENCMKCAAGTAWMAEAVADTPTEIIPLVKGATPDERAICERQAGDLGVDMVALYGSQYFGVGGGGGRSGLVNVVEAVNIETNCLPMLVLGGLSPWTAGELPKNVVAVSGLRAWRERVQPRSSTPEAMRYAYAELGAEVNQALELTPRPGTGGFE